LRNFEVQFERGNDSLVETYGDRSAKTVFVAMGSVLGTIKEVVDELIDQGIPARAVKIKCFRPFPVEELRKALKGAQFVAVIDKSISLGAEGILAADVKSAMFGEIDAKIQSFVTGLGGRDITREKLKKIFDMVQSEETGLRFIA